MVSTKNVWLVLRMRPPVLPDNPKPLLFLTFSSSRRMLVQHLCSCHRALGGLALLPALAALRACAAALFHARWAMQRAMPALQHPLAG
jgi:hypothetical protein